KESICSSHQHPADRNRAHDVAPNWDHHADPVLTRGAAGRKERLELRSEQEDQERDHESPRKDTTRKVKRRQLRPDDVADAEIGGTYARGRDFRHASG